MIDPTNGKPCEFCGYMFNQITLGRYGCPNCEGSPADECRAVGEVETDIELRCCLPSGHEGQHSYVIYPAGVKPESS